MRKILYIIHCLKDVFFLYYVASITVANATWLIYVYVGIISRIGANNMINPGFLDGKFNFLLIFSTNMTTLPAGTQERKQFNNFSSNAGCLQGWDWRHLANHSFGIFHSAANSLWMIHWSSPKPPNGCRFARICGFKMLKFANCLLPGGQTILTNQPSVYIFMQYSPPLMLINLTKTSDTGYLMQSMFSFNFNFVWAYCFN